RLLKLARMPAVVVGAFDSPRDICERWGLDLAAALEEPERRQRILQKARAIGAAVHERPSAQDVYRQMLAASVQGRKVRLPVHDEIVRDSAGCPLFRIRRQNNSIALLLPIGKVSAGALDDIRESVAAIL